MQEVAEAAKIVTSSADENAKVIFGAVIDETLGEDIRINVIATGFGERERRLSASSSEDEYATSARKKPLYTSTSGIFNKRRALEKPAAVLEPAQEMEEPLPSRMSPFTAKPVGGSSYIPPAPQPTVELTPPPVAPKKPAGDDEDLEIPAFIRRKMGI